MVVATLGGGNVSIHTTWHDAGGVQLVGALGMGATGRRCGGAWPVLRPRPGRRGCRRSQTARGAPRRPGTSRCASGRGIEKKKCWWWCLLHAPPDERRKGHLCLLTQELWDDSQSKSLLWQTNGNTRQRTRHFSKEANRTDTYVPDTQTGMLLACPLDPWQLSGQSLKSPRWSMKSQMKCLLPSHLLRLLPGQTVVCRHACHLPPESVCPDPFQMSNLSIKVPSPLPLPVQFEANIRHSCCFPDHLPPQSQRDALPDNSMASFHRRAVRPRVRFAVKCWGCWLR